MDQAAQENLFKQFLLAYSDWRNGNRGHRLTEIIRADPEKSLSQVCLEYLQWSLTAPLVHETEEKKWYTLTGQVKSPCIMPPCGPHWFQQNKKRILARAVAFTQLGSNPLDAALSTTLLEETPLFDQVVAEYLRLVRTKKELTFVMRNACCDAKECLTVQLQRNTLRAMREFMVEDHVGMVAQHMGQVLLIMGMSLIIYRTKEE